MMKLFRLMIINGTTQNITASKNRMENRKRILWEKKDNA